MDATMVLLMLRICVFVEIVCTVVEMWEVGFGIRVLVLSGRRAVNFNPPIPSFGVWYRL